ncbi:hypothetical protein NUW58_g7332 [Xylaria curta]|uniref:Uncharacterized protein n=1 Tax=Xylaria curta TaxID=42375 RepID=A0ACC1NI54_9PEZI|nr:hypothetical protein NUW58_g7332 [Xylaria curta]
MGVQHKRLIKPEDTKEYLKWLIESEGPALLEVMTDKKVPVLPMVPIGAGLHEFLVWDGEKDKKRRELMRSRTGDTLTSTKRGACLSFSPRVLLLRVASHRTASHRIASCRSTLERAEQQLLGLALSSATYTSRFKMAEPVPSVSALHDIYTPQALADQEVRWNSLLDKFQARYGSPAQFVARSPGRVNIIGEHIDYSLYPCLPWASPPMSIMAVSTDVAPTIDGTYKIRIANVDDQRFPTREFDVPYSEG